MTHPILTVNDFAGFIGQNALCVVYFSGPGCAVCEQLRPKLFGLLNSEFPQVPIAQVDCADQKVLAAEQRVFSIPTLVIFAEGRESQRFVRSFSPTEVARQLLRPYQLCYEN